MRVCVCVCETFEFVTAVANPTYSRTRILYSYNAKVYTNNPACFSSTDDGCRKKRKREPIKRGKGTHTHTCIFYTNHICHLSQHCGFVCLIQTLEISCIFVCLVDLCITSGAFARSLAYTLHAHTTTTPTFII